MLKSFCSAVVTIFDLRSAPNTHILVEDGQSDVRADEWSMKCLYDRCKGDDDKSSSDLFGQMNMTKTI